MNSLENSVIRYQINFERYKNGQVNEIIGLLDKADAEISRFIRQTDGVVTKARYKQVAEKIREVSKSLKNNVGENIDIEGLIEYELLKEKKLLDMSKKYIVNPKKEIIFKYPTLEQIKSAALFKPATDGLTYQSYLNGIEAGLFNTWDSAVRTGYLLGQSSKQIVKNVMGSVSQSDRLINAGTIQALKNSLSANTRTLLQSFANETRNMVYEANEQYLGDYDSKGDKYKYEYLATLDNRTCLVCAADDGKLFNDLNDKDTPQLPRHRGCRCVIIPYFNIEGDFRASKEGYKKNVTFDEWLREQDEETQKEVLGKTRYELYQKGEPITQFVDDGKILTIDELSQRIQYTEGIREYLYFNKIPKEELKNLILEKEIDVINKDNFIKHTDSNDPYRTNCAESSHAFELRMRGFDVVAKPTPDSSYLKNDKFLEVYKNPKKIMLEGDIKSQALKLMTDWGEGSRAIVRLSSSPFDGHLFSVINQNGIIQFIDSQSGIYNAEYFFDFIKGKNNYIIRTDKLSFTKKIKDYVSNRG